MKKENKRLQILETCFVEGRVAEIGEVIDVEESDAMHMIGVGRAKLADKDAKVGKPEAKKEDK